MAGKINVITIIPILLCLLLLACAGQHYGTRQAGGVYHRIKKGETLYRIAQAYKVNLQDLAEVNNIDKPEMIEAGRVIFIPDARQAVDDVLTSVKAAESKADIVTKPAPPPRKLPPGEDAFSPKSDERGKPPASGVPTLPQKEKLKSLPETDTETGVSGKFKEITPHKTVETKERGSAEEEDSIPAEEHEKFNLDKKRFIWPVEGKIVSRFGIQQNGMFFNGIMITAGKEAPVVAAASGTVIFSAPLKDYGETIIMKHEDNFATVYANLGQRLVKRDDHIKKGDKIAFLNRAAPEGAPAVHFEIRQKNKARNPIFFLP